ncbi:MAG: MBL fold metallo-hydrolase, partial [Proteobacteria bacterium]|nr:MBL fold metallo-hydrolase [Pseudomonadota bacterium]
MAENIQYGPVHFLGGQTRGKYPNCTSIYVEGAGVLIDPATDRELVKEIRDTKGIDQVWFTHWHEDHITHLDLLEDADL